jgi:hypothetical protein
MKAAYTLAVSTIAVIAACATSDPETEIRELLAAAEQAAEERDAGFFADLLDDAYRDARGNDRDEALRSVRGYFIANQRIELVSRVDEVLIEGADAARAVVHVGMLGRRAGAALVEGLDADLYRFELELVKGASEWRIIGARFERALGE